MSSYNAITLSTLVEKRADLLQKVSFINVLETICCSEIETGKKKQFVIY